MLIQVIISCDIFSEEIAPSVESFYVVVLMADRELSSSGSVGVSGPEEVSVEYSSVIHEAAVGV